MLTQFKGLITPERIQKQRMALKVAPALERPAISDFSQLFQVSVYSSVSRILLNVSVRERRKKISKIFIFTIVLDQSDINKTLSTQGDDLNVLFCLQVQMFRSQKMLKLIDAS